MISIACAAPRWRRIVSSRLSSGIDPDQELKAQLARALCDILEAWPQANAAALAHLHESEISRLRNNKLERFSVERLIRLIAALGYDIGVEPDDGNRWERPRAGEPCRRATGAG